MSSSKHELCSLDDESEVVKTVKSVMEIASRLQDDLTDIQSMRSCVNKLKFLLLQQRQTYAFMRPNSQALKKLGLLHNLIMYLESQLQKLQKVVHSLSYRCRMCAFMRRCQLQRIGHAIVSQLQSWLDQQCVRQVIVVIGRGSQDEQVDVISSFCAVVRKGYDPLIQDAILSFGLVPKLATQLQPDVASWDVRRETALALSLLLDFNKDIFVSLILMAKVVQYMLNLIVREPDDHVILLVSVLQCMLIAGHTIVVDEIFIQDGVPIIINLLDHNCMRLKYAVFQCVLEMVYNGRLEVVENMLELEIVKKLVKLQYLSKADMESITAKLSDKQGSHCSTTSTEMGTLYSSPRNLFADAVTRFAFQMLIGIGLHNQDKQALKLELLREIKEVIEDEVEVANITTEVLWAP